MRRLNLLLVMVPIISGCAASNKTVRRAQAINTTLEFALRDVVQIPDTLEAAIPTDSIPPDTTLISEEPANTDTLKQLAITPNGQIEIRIHAGNFSELMQGLQSLEKLFLSGADRPNLNDSILYHKLQLDNSLKTREQLLRLLAEATDLHQILEVESELSRLNGNIETLKDRLIRKLVEIRLAAAASSPSTGPAPVRPSLLETVFFYACMGISCLLMNK